MNESILEVKNLTKQYAKAPKPAVDGISFHVNEGEYPLSCLPLRRLFLPPHLPDDAGIL